MNIVYAVCPSPFSAIVQYDLKCFSSCVPCIWRLCTHFYSWKTRSKNDNQSITPKT